MFMDICMCLSVFFPAHVPKFYIFILYMKLQKLIVSGLFLNSGFLS